MHDIVYSKVYAILQGLSWFLSGVIHSLDMHNVVCVRDTTFWTADFLMYGLLKTAGLWGLWFWTEVIQAVSDLDTYLMVPFTPFLGFVSTSTW